MRLKTRQLALQGIGIITLITLSLYGIIAMIHAYTPTAWAANLLMPNTSITLPSTMSYQGILHDDAGNLLDGHYKLTFRVYDGVTATTALWEEAHEGVVVGHGHFNVLLGSTNPISTDLFADPDRFVGVTVDAHSEMMPRRRISAVPHAVYAYYAQVAETALLADRAKVADQLSGLLPGSQIEDGSIEPKKFSFWNPEDSSLTFSENINFTGDVSFNGKLSGTGIQISKMGYIPQNGSQKIAEPGTVCLPFLRSALSTGLALNANCSYNQKTGVLSTGHYDALATCGYICQ